VSKELKEGYDFTNNRHIDYGSKNRYNETPVDYGSKNRYNETPVDI